jgi:hypothetical protein
VLYGLFALLATWLCAAGYALLATVFIVLSLRTGDKRRWGRRAALSIGAVLVFLLPTLLLERLDQAQKQQLDDRAFAGVGALALVFALGVFAIGRAGR